MPWHDMEGISPDQGSTEFLSEGKNWLKTQKAIYCSMSWTCHILVNKTHGNSFWVSFSCLENDYDDNIQPNPLGRCEDPRCTVSGTVGIII